MTKQYFGIVATTMTQWWAPTVIRVSGDESVRGGLRKSGDGRLECDFPERMVLIANHQVYSPSRQCFAFPGAIVVGTMDADWDTRFTQTGSTSGG